MTPVWSARPPGDLRRSLRFVTLAWVFGSLWLYTVSGAALTRYAQLLEMPKFAFGLLAALPFAGSLIQLPASYCIQRFGQRKRIFITAGIVHRLLWVAVALIPWALPAGGRWSGLLWLVAISWVAGHVATPAWVSWMADLVPANLRGRYFSRRMQVGQLVGLITTITIGYVLDVASEESAALLMKTIALAFALAGTAGAVDFVFFLPVTEPPSAPPDPQTSWRELVNRPLADPNFRRFLGFTAMLTFSIGFVGQFAWLYVFNVVGMSNTRANVLLVVMPLVVLMIFYPLWGRLIDRLGCKPVLIIAGIFITPGAAAWIFVTTDAWVFGYIAVLIACAAWPGVELANFNILLGMGRTSGQTRPGGYVALNSLVAATAGILSGLFGGAVAEALEDWRGTLFGWPLTYHGVLFLFSAALRLLAIGWLFGLTEPKASTPQAALRYMGTNLYSNLQQAIFMPGRLLLRFTRWTYALPAGRRPCSTSATTSATNHRKSQ